MSGRPCSKEARLVGLIADLGSGPVGVDTAVIIYFIEEESRFLDPVEVLFKEVRQDGASL